MFVSDVVGVGVGDCLSVVADEVLCCAGVERRGDRGDAESSVVFGPGVAPPGGVDGLVCVDDSLRPEPPPMVVTRARQQADRDICVNATVSRCRKTSVAMSTSDTTTRVSRQFEGDIIALYTGSVD